MECLIEVMLVHRFHNMSTTSSGVTV